MFLSGKCVLCLQSSAICHAHGEFFARMTPPLHSVITCRNSVRDDTENGK